MKNEVKSAFGKAMKSELVKNAIGLAISDALSSDAHKSFANGIMDDALPKALRKAELKYKDIVDDYVVVDEKGRVYPTKKVNAYNVLGTTFTLQLSSQGFRLDGLTSIVVEKLGMDASSIGITHDGADSSFLRVEYDDVDVMLQKLVEAFGQEHLDYCGKLAIDGNVDSIYKLELA